MKIGKVRTRSVSVAALLCTTCPVLAQAPGAGSGAAAAASIEEVLVTARKREETAFDTPIALQVIGGDELARRAINDLNGIARITPLLLVGDSAGGIQGGPISMRGISGSDSNTFGDQAVSFNIDGVSVARSTVQRLAVMDIAAVEVLKGPQALFFGKNSPGGVISLRSSDPTKTFESKVSMGYEFLGEEIRGDGYISGPLTDSLSFRIAAYAHHLKGYIDNNSTPLPGTIKSFNQAPNGEEYSGRLTLLFEPNDRSRIRLKVAYNRAEDSGATSANQLRCSGATPQLASPAMDCKFDGETSLVDPGPLFNDFHASEEGGELYSNRSQMLTSLELNHDITEKVSFTSVTGLYRYHSDSLNNTGATDLPQWLILPHEKVTYRDINQEFRILSDFDGWLNFATGVQYQSSKIDYENEAYLRASVPTDAGGSTTPVTIFKPTAYQRAEAYSFFGQVILTPVDNLELSGGGRWSHEKKRIRTISSGVEAISIRPERSWSNFSPEASIAWSITPEINLFASYRKGFLSGGFNGAPAGNFQGQDLGYDEQTVEGFEVGAKARLLERTLALNLSYFDYDIKGLQVSASTGVVNTTTNAGKAYSRGVEFDADWATPVEGLALRGAVSYNKARYEVFTFNCWRGQSVAQGCNLRQNATTGLFTIQSLAGRPIVRTPEWGASMGFNYERPVGNYSIGLSGDANYSGSYYNNIFTAPLMLQDSYWTFDASLRLSRANDAWQVELIGRNLTNEYYVVRGAESPFSGAAAGAPTANRQADVTGIPNRGREIMLRFTIKPNLF